MVVLTAAKGVESSVLLPAKGNLFICPRQQVDGKAPVYRHSIAAHYVNLPQNSVRRLA